MTDQSTGGNLDTLLAALTGSDDTVGGKNTAGAAAAEVALDALAALGHQASAAALDRLAQLAASPDPDRRWWAVRALAALPHVDVLPRLLAALRDEDPPVRQCAALGLRLRADGRAAVPLVHLLGDPDPMAARLAIDALTAIGSEAVPALLEALSSRSGPGGEETGGPPPAVRVAILRALATIADTRAIPALFAALDGSTLEEYWASQGLEKMGVGMSFFKP